jgi:hypothetical protein
MQCGRIICGLHTYHRTHQHCSDDHGIAVSKCFGGIVPLGVLNEVSGEGT